MSETLELLAATSWFWLFSLGFLGSIIISSSTLLCCCHLWWVIPLYAVWIWFDRKTCERGGRPIQWVRQWSWWRLMKNYFNHKLTSDDGFTLDPKKNYILACYPHGIFPVGTFASFVDGYQSLIPKHQVFTTALNLQFWMPGIRELFLFIGAVSVSAPSIKYLLKNNTGGNAVSILIGGGDEAKYSRPGVYKIILKKRKGFIKMALQNGTGLVPVISFGETDVFRQLDFPGFSIVQNLIKNISGLGVVLPIGTHLICPNKVPVITVLGKPIDVEKNENPTSEDIDSLHETFVSEITNLFETHKHKYVKKPEQTFLEII